MKYSEFINLNLGEASEIANKNFGRVTSIVKGDDNNQVLTTTDLEIGKLLIEKIKKVYPDYNIIDEEAGVIDKGSEYTWVVDPIDGTSNFAQGLPLYGILLGLLKVDKSIAGGICLPYFDQIVVAEKGSGAYMSGKRISVTKETKLLNTLVAYGIDGHQEDPDLTYSETKTLSEIILECRNLRTSNSAYDIFQTAVGAFGASLNKTSKIWDNVAQQVVLEEAGALYTDFYGKEIDYSKSLSKAKDNFTWCAAPPKLHKQLQNIIH